MTAGYGAQQACS